MKRSVADTGILLNKFGDGGALLHNRCHLDRSYFGLSNANRNLCTLLLNMWISISNTRITFAPKWSTTCNCHNILSSLLRRHISDFVFSFIPAQIINGSSRNSFQKGTRHLFRYHKVAAIEGHNFGAWLEQLLQEKGTSSVLFWSDLISVTSIRMIKLSLLGSEKE